MPNKKVLFNKKLHNRFMIVAILLVTVICIGSLSLAFSATGSQAESGSSSTTENVTSEQNTSSDNQNTSSDDQNTTSESISSEIKPPDISSSHVGEPADADPSQKVCYLTFDDGPSNNTLKILDVLDKYGAKGTFFVVGTGKLEYVKDISTRGHSIGLHTDSHDYAKIYASTANYFADLEAINQKVKSITGKDTKIIRFPGGSSNTISKKYSKGIMSFLSKEVKNRGYKYFDWNMDSGDASGKNISPDLLVKNVVANVPNSMTRICVLMHDSAAKVTTVDALESIIKGLAEKGFVFKGLNEKVIEFHHGINN